MFSKFHTGYKSRQGWVHHIDNLHTFTLRLRHVNQLQSGAWGGLCRVSCIALFDGKYRLVSVAPQVRALRPELMFHLNINTLTGQTTGETHAQLSH